MASPCLCPAWGSGLAATSTSTSWRCPVRSPYELEHDLNELLAAWERLAPEDSFAGLTFAEFNAAVRGCFTARARLEELRLDEHQWLLQRALEDGAAIGKYRQVILSIRCHSKHGGNSPVLRAAGYVTDLERASGLSRPGSAEEPTPAPAG